MSRIYGAHAVGELLDVNPSAISALVVSRGAVRAPEQALVDRARALGIPTKDVEVVELKQRGGGRGGVAIGADLRLAAPVDVADLHAEPGERRLIVALDGVTDPHNLGAIVRSAAAFGAECVLVPKDRAASLTDAAVRASTGAVAHVAVTRVTNLARALRTLQSQGFWVIGSDVASGTPLWEADLTGPVVLVMGAEGTGLRPGVLKACDLAIHLPTPGPVGSLNVSVFAGIALAEVARQRAQNQR